MGRTVRWLVLAAASGGFLSYLPAWLRRRRTWKGSGLVGTLWGVIAIPWLPSSGGTCLAMLCLVAGGAILISEWAEQSLQTRDDPRIVIDEFAGYWVTMAWVPRQWEFLLMGFVVFRVFDVCKLPWVRRAGDLPGGVGVVADDLFAGVLSNMTLRLISLGISG